MKLKAFKGKGGSVTENGFLVLIGLILSVLFIYFLIKVGLAFATKEDQGTRERFNVLVDTIKSLEDGKSKELNIYIKDGLVLYGFNKDKKSINYYTGLAGPFGSIGEVRLPLQKIEICKEGCLCICDIDCNNVKDCKSIEGINYFYAKTKYNDANRGVEAGNNHHVAFFGESGKGYLNNVHWGVRYTKVERSGDTIYFS